MIRDLGRLYRGRLVVVLVLGALNLVLFAAVLRPAREAARAREAEAVRAGNAMRGAAAAASLADTKRRAEALLEGFPTRTRLLAVTARVQGAARDLGLRVPAVDYRPDAQGNGAPLERTTIALRVEGPYAAVRRLVHEVEREPRALVIDALALRATDRGVALALDLSAYASLTVPTMVGGARPALREPIEVPALRVDLIDRTVAPYRPERRNPFAFRDAVARRPAGAPAPRPAPVPTPLAPATPDPEPAARPALRFLGTVAGERGVRAFVGAGGEVLVVKRGDRLAPGYVVEEIHPEVLVLRAADGEQKVVLSLREGARHAP